MRRRRVLYGWLKGPKEWCLSRQPPDIPVPHLVFETMEEAAAAASGSRCEVIWCGDALTAFEAAERERKRAL